MPGASPAWGTVSSTKTPGAATARCLTRGESGPVTTSEKQTPAACRISSFSVADFRARVSALLEAGMGSQTPEERCSLNLPEWLKPGSLRICCLKTYPACLAMTAAGRLRPSSMRWTDWGMAWNGRCLTARISMCPSQDAGCTLWDILTPDAPEKYYLSEKQMMQLLPRSEMEHREAGCTTPQA